MHDVNEFIFDSITPVEFPVSFGKDKYVLSVNGAADVWYKETLVRIAKFDIATQKPTSTEGLNSVDPGLVGRCLYLAPKKEDSKPVGEAFVLSLDPKIISKLAKKVKELGGLDDGKNGGDDDNAKNSLPAAGPG
jgi:hypothetical protein